MKIGIVVQRYGAEIAGGAEHHSRMIAERLQPKHEVTVLTTCARDYLTWKNEYPEGISRINGVLVRRFPTVRERHLESFNRFSDHLFYNNHTTEDELKWLEDQGPFCPSLIEYLAKEKENFDRFLFFTYLYYPTYHGLQIAPNKSALVPTAHDEPAIRLGIFRDVFSKPYGLIFNTDAEREFVDSLVHLKQPNQAIAGVGVNLPEKINKHIFQRKQGLMEDYILYCGRIDAGKGCQELIDFYLKKKQQNSELPLLLLSGHRIMQLPSNRSIIYLGYLTEEEKEEAIQGAICVTVPSRMESLSMLLLESFASRTPVLVKESAVLRDHCVKSNAGLFYDDYFEFSEALDYLIAHPHTRRQMGLNGQRYVHNYYSWPRIISIYEQILCVDVDCKQNATL